MAYSWLRGRGAFFARVFLFLMVGLPVAFAQVDSATQIQDDLPGNPVPPEKTLPKYDDTVFYRTTTIEARGAYQAFGDNSGYSHGAGIGAVVFLDAGKLGILVRANVGGSEQGLYAFAEGDIQFRARFRIDPDEIWWASFGADLSGRHARDSHLDSYVNVQPMAAIGMLYPFDDSGQCVLHLFAKAALGIWDTRTQSPRKWDASFDTLIRPGVGAETLLDCTDLRIRADYEHVFALGSGGDADAGSLESSYVVRLSRKPGETFSIGGFVRGEFLIEHGASGLDPADPHGKTRSMGGVFVGPEIRF
ncbi:MAG: hypothetical protein AB1540_07895 [Bdellovibrionota bacterium]